MRIKILKNKPLNEEEVVAQSSVDITTTPEITFESNPLEFILQKYPSLNKTLVNLMTEDFRDYSSWCLNKCYVSILTYIDNLSYNPQAEIVCKPIKPSVSQPINCKSDNHQLIPQHANEITQSKNVIIIQGSNGTMFNIN